VEVGRLRWGRERMAGDRVGGRDVSSEIVRPRAGIAQLPLKCDLLLARRVMPILSSLA